MLPWFRLYFEARNDKKLDSLSSDQFRVWFNLLCLSAEHEERELRGQIIGYDDEVLSVEVANGDVELLKVTVDRLIRLRMLRREEDGTLTFINFEKRNHDKPSDTPEATRDRKRRQREREKAEREREGYAVTPESHERHAPVTPGHAIDRDREVDRDRDREEKEDDESGADAPARRAGVKREYPHDSEEYRLASLLRSRVRDNIPNVGEIPEPTLQKWANTVRLMVQRDQRTHAEIEALIDWAQADEFWFSNILSMDGLREKFDKVLAQKIRKERQSERARSDSPNANGHGRPEQPAYGAIQVVPAFTGVRRRTGYGTG